MARWLMALGLVAGLAGCTVTTGFDGPGYSSRAGLPGPADGTVIVALTNGKLGGTSDERGVFWKNSRDVVTTLAEQPGYLGHALKLDFWNREVWTMTVWEDRESLNAFVDSRIHQRAMDQSTATFSSSRFARTEMRRDAVPLDWPEIFEILERTGRTYYE